jgi:hypothetical protein
MTPPETTEQNGHMVRNMSLFSEKVDRAGGRSGFRSEQAVTASEKLNLDP